LGFREIWSRLRTQAAPSGKRPMAIRLFNKIPGSSGFDATLIAVSFIHNAS
jgi:hypothetical protein